MSWVKRLRLQLPRLAHPTIVAPVAVVVGAIAITALGLADIGIGWILAGTGALTVGGLFVGRALEADAAPESRVRYLAMTLMILIVVLTGSWLYPSLRNEPAPHYFTLTENDEAKCLHLASSPGGRPALLGPEVCGGTPYGFDCELTIDGVAWLRRSSVPPYWMPRDLLQPVTSADAEVPRCP